MKQKHAALLCRVSTVDKQSTIRQVEELTTLAKNKGYLVGPEDIYEDKVSGFSKYETRPALNKLIENIRTKKKHYSMVFVMEISRISRKPEEGQKILILFSDMNVPIYVKNINMCTHMEGDYDRYGKLKRNQMFGIVFTLLSEFAATEAEYFRERSISGIRSSLKNGKAGGGVFKPYGYTKDKDGMLMIDETERGVVEDIFNYASKGYGITTIANLLNDSGIPTKAQKVVKKGFISTRGTGLTKRTIKTAHIKWTDAAIHGILTNTIYKGKRQIKVDEQFVDGKKIPVYNLVPAPAIIEVELFDRIQKMRSDNYNKRSAELRYMYILKNLCICGKCGRNLVGRFKPDSKNPDQPPTDAYYQCSSKRAGFGNCGNYSVNIEAIESVVWNVITHSPKVFEYFQNTGTQLKDANEKMDQVKLELKIQEKSLMELERERETILMMTRKGMYTEEEGEVEWKKLLKKIDNIQNIINRTRKHLTSVSEMRLRLSNMDSYIHTINQMKMDRFQIVQVFNDILDRVTVTSTERNGIGVNYLVSVYFKGMLLPITVYMLTKMRHRRFKDFDMDDPEVLAETGQNRFIYVPGGMLGEEVIQYNKNGILVSDTQSVVNYIMKRKIKKSEIVQSVYEESVFDKDTEWVWPELLPFDDTNSIDKVRNLEMKRKRKMFEN